MAMELKEEGRSVWLVATLGPFGPGVKRDSCGAPRRTVQRSVVTDEALTVGLKSWSRGQKSQAASAICSGGVSAVMGSSDLDAPTFGSRGAPGNQLSCSLPSGAHRSIVGMACWLGLFTRSGWRSAEPGGRVLSALVSPCC